MPADGRRMRLKCAVGKVVSPRVSEATGIVVLEQMTTGRPATEEKRGKPK